MAAAAPAVWRTFHLAGPAVPTTNRVTIDTTPPGSTVLIDGVEQGKTPYAGELPVGLHKVELRLRKNVRTLDLDVTPEGTVAVTIEWPKGPAPRKRAPAKPKAEDTAGDARTGIEGGQAPSPSESPEPGAAASAPAARGDVPATPDSPPPADAPTGTAPTDAPGR